MPRSRRRCRRRCEMHRLPSGLDCAQEPPLRMAALDLPPVIRKPQGDRFRVTPPRATLRPPPPDGAAGTTPGSAPAPSARPPTRTSARTRARADRRSAAAAPRLRRRVAPPRTRPPPQDRRPEGGGGGRAPRGGRPPAPGGAWPPKAPPPRGGVPLDPPWEHAQRDRRAERPADRADDVDRRGGPGHLRARERLIR